MSALSRFARAEGGAVGVEAALMSGLFIVLIGGGVEMGMAYHQHNAAQIAARHGARLAATGAPVTSFFDNHTGLGGGVSAGDPLPDYRVECSGASQQCDSGRYDASAMSRLVHGPDGPFGDTSCAEDGRRNQGMCDFVRLDASKVRVAYESSGLGTAGNPADPVPMITVTVTGLEYNFILVDRLLPGVRRMRDVSASVIAEGLEGI